MADRYLSFTATAPGRFLTRRLGLPQPAALLRFSPERPSLTGTLVHLTAGTSTLDLSPVLARTGLGTGSGDPAAVVLDAAGVRDLETLAEVHAALHPVVRSVAASGRIVVLGAPLDAADHQQAAVQQALEGFTRSLGKEIGRGRTVNLVRVTDAGAAESTLRFLLSPKSAYVSGQVVEVGGGEAFAGDWERPLAGRIALVTGGARGIGAAVAETLARDGAEVVVLDVPQAEDEARRLASRLGGRALALDITAADAGERIAAELPDGLDVLIHNAGITRDRRLVNMPAERWSSVLDVNLASVLRTTDALLGKGALRPGGRIVATASIAGLAGNAGQTNYGASKAGIAGLVRALAPRALAEHGVTVNAVAPGFIETKMTAAVPLFIREAGRRMNSLAQGGIPADVAETTAWLAHPASGAVNGQVVRVCGQSLLGA
ncbi:3-oxoacyl-ACP reductase [Streptomyces acidiscabies]|uniref:3-oxoacyl-ACP reductase n=3 Tax=Streptomyces acidiscabies TaxID=42234 RepID=A0AAP6BA28_9ACTN|nr:3-oxoacyl-ACP reductase [Streptomyces acidiscabies]MBP5937689.1 3-oxoacyl-ACP reductase [Streptomyces sp. LBUM 1476]MBZ3914200.1 3-oxoacyl-ACP reductase [Streptomyces acidiscabies]MDX2960833.1 3-oxoacyl-ACP reductase [Streptomyces acidiscabies]MDX3016890.1 3-oxoacyl-ACP reductase [Streptomyces acidiscabies]MDX3788842.1 3-oxoacyl-ACP reductase [Streptomyces acidiscabies]